MADKDVVVDRRAVLEEEDAPAKEQRFSELKEGKVIKGTVRNLPITALSSISAEWTACCTWQRFPTARVNKPADALTVGQQVEVQDPEGRRRQEAHLAGHEATPVDPWTPASEKYHVGDRVNGTVTRVAEFGAFVELETGLEGLIHLSEMSWSKKIRKPSDIVKPGDEVDVVDSGQSIPPTSAFLSA